jgi:hypothetical protein
MLPFLKKLDWKIFGTVFTVTVVVVVVVVVVIAVVVFVPISEIITTAMFELVKAGTRK